MTRCVREQWPALPVPTRQRGTPRLRSRSGSGRCSAAIRRHVIALGIAPTSPGECLHDVGGSLPLRLLEGVCLRRFSARGHLRLRLVGALDVADLRAAGRDGRHELHEQVGGLSDGARCGRAPRNEKHERDAPAVHADHVFPFVARCRFAHSSRIIRIFISGRSPSKRKVSILRPPHRYPARARAAPSMPLLHDEQVLLGSRLAGAIRREARGAHREGERSGLGWRTRQHPLALHRLVGEGDFRGSPHAGSICPRDRAVYATSRAEASRPGERLAPMWENRRASSCATAAIRRASPSDRVGLRKNHPGSHANL
jgi:hypothetical protein